MSDNSANSIIRILRDQVNAVKKYDIYTEDAIYRTDYYHSVLEHIGDLSMFNSSDPNCHREKFLKIMKDIIDAGVGMGEEYKAKASFYDLYLYPIRNHFDLFKKSYSDYNIDIEFFRNIKETNTSAITNGEYGVMFQLDSFKFVKEKLSSFTLHNIDNGMKYRYNSKYELDTIIFVDDSELKVDIRKKSKKSGSRN